VIASIHAKHKETLFGDVVYQGDRTTDKQFRGQSPNLQPPVRIFNASCGSTGSCAAFLNPFAEQLGENWISQVLIISEENNALYETMVR
jgi:hypothetical protein